MELMIVRHGETVANVEHVYQGQTHGKLNGRGIAQAYELKESLRGQDIDIVFCSDLKRAVDTAEIITRDRDVEVVYDRRLRERFLGELQGKKIDDNTKCCDFGDIDGGLSIEPIEEMFNRVSSFINDISEIAEVNGYRNILVVSHGITINVFKAISLGEGVEELREYKTVGNCSLQVMEFHE